MIAETKEELVKQLTRDWNLLARADEALEESINRLTNIRKDLRNHMRQHDTTGVRRPDGVGTPGVVQAGSEVETRDVHGMPHVRKEYKLRS